MTGFRHLSASTSSVTTLATAVDDHGNSIATASVLPMGGTASGTVNVFGDVDMFKLDLQANHAYMFSTVRPFHAKEGTMAPVHYDNTLVLLDGHGAELARATVIMESNQLSFTAPESGTYFLSYTHDWRYTSRNGAYTVRASDITGDTQAPALTMMGSTGVEPRRPILIAADEFLNVKGTVNSLSADAHIQLTDMAGKSVAVTAIVTDHGTHSVLSIDPLYDLSAGVDYTLKLNSQAVADNAGNYAAAATFTFTATTPRMAMALQGTVGNDVLAGPDGAGSLLLGRAGDDTITGHGKSDTSLYVNNRDQYTVLGNSKGMMVSSSAEGRDLLSGIERIEFADKVIIYSSDGIEGQGYRMYRAAFDRTPDADGLGFYVKLLGNGYTPYTIAPFFLQSPEGRAKYGNDIGNSEFVQKLYQNVLHRNGEADGVSFWVDLLDRNVLSKPDVLVGFSESPENVATTAILIGAGFEYTMQG